MRTWTWTAALFFAIGMVWVGCSSDGSNCASHAGTACEGGITYWLDSCGKKEEQKQTCECGCKTNGTACKTLCNCVPCCDNKECGDNCCQDECLPGCTSNQTCNVSGHCEACTSHSSTVCTNNVTYWKDSCGNQEGVKENCSCGCNVAGTACKTDCGCVPQCTNKECGPSGCVDPCPPGCGVNEVCNEGTGQCCVKQCGGKECGSDGCGGTCAPGCSGNEVCNQQTGQCICTANCTNKECGPDGCGGNCPPGCSGNETCNYGNGQCESCVPDCNGKECGPDGCQGTCSPGCSGNEICNNLTGQCYTPNVTLDWVTVPGGSFSMGTPLGTSGSDSSERPVHSVSVTTFQMTKSEITVAQYKACVNASGCLPPVSDEGVCYYSQEGKDNFPVVCLDWNKSKTFCEWAGGHLPSEAQWEFAAKGGTDILYPWGNTQATCTVAVMNEIGSNGCGTNGPWAVCSKTAGNSPDGLCDMSGNVWEWVQDYYHNDYNGAPVDGSAWNTIDGQVGDYRVIRGGSYNFGWNPARAGSRMQADPYYSDTDMGSYGFRCVK
jgi:formylglycine-generating enzyme required for sulfatase activity